jgi:hypothetical protein
MDHMQTTHEAPVGVIAPRRRLAADGTVALVAMLAASVAWACANAAGMDLEVHSGSGTNEITIVPVIVTPMLATVVGVGLLRLLERRTTRALRVWTIVAVAVWALSFLGPISATAPGTGFVLAGIHLLVGAVIVFGVRRTHATVTPVA